MATIRLTQQYIEYLSDATTNSDLRVTKVFAQVVTEFIQVAAASDTFSFSEIIVEGQLGQGFDTLIFGETAVAGLVTPEAASDTLTYVEEAILDLARAEDTLVYTDTAEADQSEYNAAATDTWALNESADSIAFVVDTLAFTEQADQRDVAEDTLSLSEVLTVNADYNVAITDAYPLTEVLAENVDYLTFVTDVMDQFVQVYDPVTNTFTEVQIAGWRDTADVAGPIYGDSSDIMLYAETPQGWDVPPDGAASFSEAATDTWTINESAVVPIEADASDTWAITETADADVSQVSEDTLTFTEEASATQDYALAPASDTWDLQETLAYTVDDGSSLIECIYAPFLGSSVPGAPTPPPASYPAATGTGFKLQFPAGAPTETLELPNPEFGNQDRLEISRVVSETAGGTLVVFRDPNWPSVETLLMTFINMTEAQAYALRDFIEAHPGVEINMVDHEDRVWVGVITQPNDPIVQDGRGCQYTSSFEFQGVLV